MTITDLGHDARGAGQPALSPSPGVDVHRRLVHALHVQPEVRIELQLMPEAVRAFLPWRRERHFHLELATAVPGVR